MTFVADTYDQYAKRRRIHDTGSDVTLYLDTDDVNPDDVTDEKVQALVYRLNNPVLPSCVECPDCGAEVDTRTARAL